jgi:prepilin-type N-terminal cleavage/methylation domain-containing protein
MKKLKKRKNEGFTLVEVIAVLVILGILAAVAVPKYIDLQQNAQIKALDAGVSELNGREAMTWGDSLLSEGGYDADDIAGAMNYVLGADYTGDDDGEPTTLTFGTASYTMTKVPSTATSPATWTGTLVL